MGSTLPRVSPVRAGVDSPMPEVAATSSPAAVAFSPTRAIAGSSAGLLELDVPGPEIRASRLHGGEHGPQRRGRIRALVMAMRPTQWVKNVLVIAAPGAAGVLVRDDVPARVALAFAAFCLLSASTYLINDVRDVNEDRRHPRKRHRPIAAGELEPRVAVGTAAALAFAGLALCLLVRPLLLAVGAGYLVVTCTYTAFWRHIAVVDVGAIAAGFVLRALAGGVAAPVALSRSFVLVVTFGAVFVAAGKRHAELARISATGAASRRALATYTITRLRIALAASATFALAGYSVWAFAHPALPGSAWRQLTLAPFAACLARYALLVRRGGGEAPEQLLLDDRVLQLFALVWTVGFALSVHAVG
jgi:decaprenyl-phosphate phosphoribosyltransferase